MTAQKETALSTEYIHRYPIMKLLKGGLPQIP